MPSQTVNLASLTDASGARVYPGAVAPPAGPVSIGELKAVNDRQLLLIERDNHGDDLTAPRFKKVFLLDLPPAASSDGYVGKTQLVDLLAIPDPSGVGGDGDFFRLPFYTIESVHVVDERTLLRRLRQQLPVLQRPLAQPERRSQRPARRRRHRDHPGPPRHAARRRPRGSCRRLTGSRGMNSTSPFPFPLVTAEPKAKPDARARRGPEPRVVSGGPSTRRPGGRLASKQLRSARLGSLWAQVDALKLFPSLVGPRGPGVLSMTGGIYGPP